MSPAVRFTALAVAALAACRAGAPASPPPADPCAGVTCTGVKVCVAGVCQDPPDPCAGVTCTGGKVCVAGACVPATSTPTDVPAGNVSGHWTVAGSPYRVWGDLVVPRGATLTIDPGVRVEFQAQYKLSLRGGLSAVGTAAAPVVFTTSAADLARGSAWIGWLGIRIDGSEYDTGTATDPVDHGPGLWELRFCEIAYVDKSSGLQQHPWKEAVGNFYGHGFYASDLVFDDNWLHHGRTSLLALYPGSIGAASFGGVGTYRRNVLEDGQPGPALDIAHVYFPIGTPGALHFVGGAVRRMATSNYATVVWTWDSPVYLDGVEITGCGDRMAAPWFEAVNAGAAVTYTPP